MNDLHAQAADPGEALPPRTRRRVAIYLNGQRIVAQVLGPADIMLEGQHLELSRLLAKGLPEQRLPTVQVCNDVLCVIMACRAPEEIVLGDVSVFGAGGPNSGLAAATTIAMGIELKAGFGGTGTIYMGELNPASTLATATIASVRRGLEAALARASALFIDNMEELEPTSERGA